MPRSDLRLHAARLWDGAGPIHEDRVVEIRGGQIRAIRQGDARDADLSADLVVPGFIDLQINGAGGVMFNDAPTAATLATIAAAARAGGTAWLTPTFITAPDRAYLAALAAGAEALAAGMPGILGVHLEGPFLSPERPGVHRPEFIRRADGRDLALLCAPRPGTNLLTLAPEEQAPETLERLAAAGWRLFAGHSAATWAQALAAVPLGLRGVTHLFNASSQLGSREPGLVGAALTSGLYGGLIADGVHVHPANVALAVRAMPGRLYLVTDAMATLGTDLAGFVLDGRPIRREGGRLIDADGRLAGAHLALDEALRNIMRFAGLTLEAALPLLTTVPAAALGLSDRLGRIAPGRAAGLTLLDEALGAAGVVLGAEIFGR
jgi:N-acetylglucosamine-6-phosphate deacetylase